MIDELIESQGWTAETVLELVFRYCEVTGQIDALADWMQRVADEESEAP